MKLTEEAIDTAVGVQLTVRAYNLQEPFIQHPTAAVFSSIAVLLQAHALHLYQLNCPLHCRILRRDLYSPRLSRFSASLL